MRGTGAAWVSWLASLLFVTAPCALADEWDRTIPVNVPYAEWHVTDTDYRGNPFDLEAWATFTHEASGERLRTGLFYTGEHTWAFRFTGTRTGRWKFRVADDREAFGGIEGVVDVVDTEPGASPAPGFIGSRGGVWMREGVDRAYVPQLVMQAVPRHLYGESERIARDIEVFLGEHGFNGFHVPGGCYWFDLDVMDCREITSTEPDPRVFEALEDLILATYAAGGSVHLWLWGDTDRHQNPNSLPRSGWRRVLDLPGGAHLAALLPGQSRLNAPEARRVYRYIAARLGPLPGWSMGFGFDIWEWADEADLATWYRYMREHLGWPVYLGARGPKHALDQLYEGFDYAGYEQHRPDYETYVDTFLDRPEKPSLSEDRFRIRDSARFRGKDYDMARVRRGLWHSVMAGGVGNIWGHLPDGRDQFTGSAPFPEPVWIDTHRRFFENRFRVDLRRCPSRHGVRCLHTGAGDRYLLYAEDTDLIEYEPLPGDAAVRQIRAVDTLAPYAEIRVDPVVTDSGLLWRAPHASDWALAIRLR